LDPLADSKNQKQNKRLAKCTFSRLLIFAGPVISIGVQAEALGGGEVVEAPPTHLEEEKGVVKGFVSAWTE